MKTIMRFDMSDVDDREAFDRAHHGSNYLCALEDISNLIRQKTKYSEDDAEANFYAAFSELFGNILHENDVKLN